MKRTAPSRRRGGAPARRAAVGTSSPDRMRERRRLSRIWGPAGSRGRLRRRPICGSAPRGACYNPREIIREDSMLQLVAALALLAAAPLQDKPKPADEGEETVAARKGNLTPVYELEATYEAVESAE